jgi:hypothetical protein
MSYREDAEMDPFNQRVSAHALRMFIANVSGRAGSPMTSHGSWRVFTAVACAACVVLGRNDLAVGSPQPAETSPIKINYTPGYSGALLR